MANTVSVVEKPIPEKVSKEAYVLGIQDDGSGKQALYRLPLNEVRANGANDLFIIPALIEQYGTKQAFTVFVNANAEYDSLTNLADRFFKAAASAVTQTYTSQFYRYNTSNSSLGTKMADNEGLICTPSTIATAGQDDYADLPLFACFDVNYTIDANSLEPVIHAKYAAGYDANGLLSSVSGVQPATYRPGSAGSVSISHDGQIALWRARGNQYAGSSMCDGAFMQLMLEIKYANLGNAGVMSGCRSYSSTYAAAVSESGVNRIVLTTSQANYFIVGSRVSLGTGTDRAKATCYDVHDIATVASIEDVTINGTAYKAVVLATEAVFNTEAGVTNIIPQPWLTGSTDGVQGNDGSPTNNTSGKEPFKIQGIEVMLGMYEVYADITTYEDATVGYTVYADRLAADIVKSKAGANAVTLGIIPKEGAAAWKYNAELNWDANDQESYMIPTQMNGTSSTGYRSAIYRDGMATVGWREWRAFGLLSLGGYCGLACARLNGALGAASWDFGARPCGSGANRGEFTPAVAGV